MVKKRAEKLNTILPQVLEKIKLKREEKKEFFSKLWQEVGGEEICQHSQIVGFKQKQLVVNVDSSAWLYHLSLIKEQLLKKLKKKLKKRKLEQIYLRLGEVE